MRCSMLRSVDAIRRVRAYRRVSRRKSSSRGGATTHTSTPASASARCTAVEYTPVLSIRSFVRKTQLLLAELHDVQRFPMARALMAYLGLVPGEHSSRDRHRRGPITKTGNSLARRRVVATPWPPRRRGGSVWPVRTLPTLLRDHPRVALLVGRLAARLAPRRKTGRRELLFLRRDRTDGAVRQLGDVRSKHRNSERRRRATPIPVSRPVLAIRTKSKSFWAFVHQVRVRVMLHGAV